MSGASGYIRGGSSAKYPRPLLAAAQEIGKYASGAAASAPAPAIVILVVVMVAITVLTPVLVPFVSSLVPGFGVQKPLELTTVEEDPPAVPALVDQDAVALVGL